MQEKVMGPSVTRQVASVARSARELSAYSRWRCRRTRGWPKELGTSTMSAAVVNPVGWAVRFYEAPIGKKAVMAITGVMLVGYVLAHMLGNLQIYSSNRDQINT